MVVLDSYLVYTFILYYYTQRDGKLYFTFYGSMLGSLCPYGMPGQLIENLTWFKRPGVASVFTPSLGTVHECRTSTAVTIIWIGEFIGNTARLSVSSNQNISVCRSSM
jgi:hypothetical protein